MSRRRVYEYLIVLPGATHRQWDTYFDIVSDAICSDHECLCAAECYGTFATYDAPDGPTVGQLIYANKTKAKRIAARFHDDLGFDGALVESN